jgi:hypothetical protein
MAGELRTLTWKGSNRKAPETPPMEVKVETARATRIPRSRENMGVGAKGKGDGALIRN